MVRKKGENAQNRWETNDDNAADLAGTSCFLVHFVI